jgi:CRP-like cAMP-binding protein
MVEKETLKQIYFLKDMPGHILEKVGQIARIQDFEEETVLFRQNEEQTTLYMLLKGKVFLNSRSAKGQSLTLDEVFPGRTFGVHTLLNESSGNFSAICAEPCQMIVLSGETMRQLFKQDFEAGHVIMQKVVELFKIRTDRHTRQLLQSLKIHPEIKKLQ